MSRTEEDPQPLSAPEVRRRAVAGVRSIAGREIALRALGLVGNVVLARLLLPADFGTVAFGYTLIAFGAFLSDGGIGGRLIQRPHEPTVSELRALQGFILAATFGAFVLIAAVSVPLGRPGAIATVMALSLPIAALSNPCAVVAERSMSYRPLIVGDIVKTVTYNAVAIGLVLAGADVWGLAIAVVISTIVGTTCLLAIGPVGLVRPSFSLHAVRPFLSFGLQFQAVGVIGTLRDQGLNLVAVGIGGLPVLGVWSLATRVLQAILVVFNSLWRVSFPAVSRLIESGENPQLAIQRALELITTFTGFFVVGIASTAPALVPVAFGGKWENVVPVLPWAAAGIMIAGPISTAAVGLFYARGEPKVVLRAVVAHTVTWFAVAVPLLPHFGAEALGIGWFLGAMVDAAILAHALSRVGVRAVSKCALPTLATASVGVVGWYVASTVEPATIALLASLVTVESLYLLAMLSVRRATLLDLYGLLRRSARRQVPA